MFHHNRFLNLVLWGMLGAFASGCTGGGCSGCSFDELPEGGLPASQTVEGGAQIRVTESGFDTVEALITTVFDDLLASGFQTGPIVFWDDLGFKAGFCLQNGSTGCQIDVSVNDFTTEIDPTQDTLTVGAAFSIDSVLDLGVYGWAVDLFFGGPQSCNLNVDITDASFEFDIDVGVRNSDGELDIRVAQVGTLDLGDTSVVGCGVLGDFIDGAFNIADELLSFLTTGLVGDLFQPVLAPLAEMLLDQFLPDPLGLEGSLDVGALLSQFSPSTDARLETKLIPGGYADIVNSGLSLGVITGFNSDRDPATRGADASEPALCVPPLPAPAFGAAPHSLGTVARDYGSPFVLQAADEFLGNPDPTSTDLALGASETMLDQLGHHLVTSGALCLSISTEAIEQFNLGTVGLIVPSFAELGSEDGKDPLMLVVRPLEALDFAIGTGGDGDPALQIAVNDLQVDFYAFIFERWVRGFSIELDANIGIDLEFTTDANGDPAVLPILSGLESENLSITVLNEDFLRESAAELEAVFPSLLDLALPLVTGALGEITLPTIGGFTLTDLSLSRVSTSEDDFLAITGAMGTSQTLAPMLDVLSGTMPKTAAYLDSLRIPTPEKVETRIDAAAVDVPAPAAIHRGLLAGDRSRLPAVVLEVPAQDELGRPLEYTWSLGGGVWRPFAPGGRLSIRESVFAIQGDYDIHLRARIQGRYQTLDTTAEIVPVRIDSVAPRIHAHRARSRAGVTTVPVSDLVSDSVRVAFSPLGADQPTTAWTASGTIATAELRALAGDNDAGAVTVWAEDDSGNVASSSLQIDTPQAAAGCSAATGRTGLGVAILVGALLALFGLRRRSPSWRAAAAGLGMTLMVVSPGCSCSSDTFSCELNEDCADQCEAGTVPICAENGQCLCADDVPFGRTGQYSSFALGAGTDVWVSAYNSTHGDLMIARWEGSGRVDNSAWQFVDGVPDGPVVIPGSEIREGITDKGDDVGLYTDIAADGDLAYVSYYDRTGAALKLAANYGGEIFETHTIETGSGLIDEDQSFVSAGQYSSITLDPEGRPGIAYFWQSGEGGEVTTEVRWAQATSSQPRGPNDWTITTVDSTTLADELGDGLRIPEGLGLFVNSVRRADGSPAIVYYDRQLGALKLATVGEDGFVVEILDGDADGLDVGWYPSVTEDQAGVLHVSYVDAIDNDLLYVNTDTLEPELVDDGRRLVGTNSQGLPVPEFHFVGDDSAIVMAGGVPYIAYQNATTHELLIASPDGDAWNVDTVAGGGESFAGGYGFYARAESRSNVVVMSSWVIDQPNYDAWVEIFRRQTVIE